MDTLELKNIMDEIPDQMIDQRYWNHSILGTGSFGKVIL